MSGLKLPEIRRERVVLFHLQYPDSTTDLVLQIPPKEKGKPSNTFSIDLKKPVEMEWVRRLRNYRLLLDELNLYGHAAFYPVTGLVRSIEDKDAKNPTIIQIALEEAKQDKEKGPLCKWADVKPGATRTRLSPFDTR